ncbi:MAG: CHASE domain-containing protein [Alphaproteobacteria bacterium]|nr:CHASE domain-containing protein [Alphaproteobacteria bacterium]
MAGSGVALAAATYWRSVEADRDRARTALELRAEWRAYDLQHKILAALHPVEAAAVYVASEPRLSPERFARFASGARRGKEPIRVMMWAPAVPAAEREAFEHGLRESGVSGFRILERRTAGLSAAEPREEYLPVLMAYAYTPPAFQALGVDLLSEPNRRAAALRARDEGRPVATRPVAAMLQPSVPTLLAVFVPVYDSRDTPADPVARRAAWRGNVAASFEFARLLSAAMENTPEPVAHLRVAVTDERNPSPVDVAHAFYDPVVRGFASAGASGVAIGTSAPDSGHRTTRSFAALGLRWTIVFDFPRAVLRQNMSDRSWLWPALVLAMTGLLLAYLARAQSYTRDVELAVHERTAGLEDANRRLAAEAEQRERAAAAAREVSEMLKATIDAAPSAIVSMDAARRIVLWNRAATRIFGYGAEEVQGRPYKILVPPGLEPDHEGYFRRISTHGQLNNIVTKRRRKDGTDIAVRVSGGGLFAEDGAFLGAVFALDDVTREQLIEQQLRQAQKMEAIGNLTGGIAHDFNNMLGVIVGNLDLMEESLPRDGEATRFARQALEGALRGAELVRRLLAFSRRQALTPAAIDVRPAIEGIAPLLRRTLGENMLIELAIDPDAGTIEADKNQLENALLNLAINARDAMPQGGRIWIAARRQTVDGDNAPMYPELSPGDYVAISVTDSGQGIPPEVLPRVFEPFFTTKQEGKGTGLGLAMIYGFMRQSGGTAKIYSEVGQGTTVRLYFPAVSSGAAAAAEPADAAIPQGSGERVLVVEDRDDMRSVAINTLERLGYRTVGCASGDAALALLSDGERFDLVFSDIVMPGAVSGLDLAQEIRKRALDCAVLLTSGYASPKAVSLKAEQLGLQVISKPYRAANLARAMRAALDRRAKGGDS